MFGSAESEHPRLGLTNREIISEEFQHVITIHQRHRETDGQTTCDRKSQQDRALH